MYPSPNLSDIQDLSTTEQERIDAQALVEIDSSLNSESQEYEYSFCVTHTLHEQDHMNEEARKMIH